MTEVRLDQAIRVAPTVHALQRRVGEAVLVEMVEAYRAGDAAVVLAARFGVSQTAVYEQLERHGVERRRAKISPEQHAEMVRLRAEGWSYRKIAERFGVTRMAVSRRLQGGPTALDGGPV